MSHPHHNHSAMALYGLLKAKEASNLEYLQGILNSPGQTQLSGITGAGSSVLGNNTPFSGPQLTPQLLSLAGRSPSLQVANAAVQRLSHFGSSVSLPTVSNTLSAAEQLLVAANLPSVPDLPSGVAAHRLQAGNSGREIRDLRSHDDETEMPFPVRKEKIEEAIRSKPQRGRKRVCLTETERLELTRTRNREHAKSTRLRKKARHQELVESESKLIKLESAQELDDARRQNVAKFFSIREMALRKIHLGDSAAGAKAQGDAKPTESKDGECKGLVLADVVEDVDTFRFDCQQIERNTAETSLKKLEVFDKFAASTLTVPGSSAKEAGKAGLAFKFSGNSTDSVALSKSGAGFAQVDLVQSLSDADQGECLQFSAIVSFQFADESSKITAVEIFPIKQFSATKSDPQEANRHLGSQQVFPSVVSLDRAKNGADVKQDESAEDAETGKDLGMGI